MLYKRDYRFLTEEEKANWNKAEEILHQSKIISVENRKKYDKLMPEAAWHYKELFPNNYLNITTLKDKEYWETMKCEFQTLLNKNPNEREILNYIKDKEYYFLVASILIYYPFGHHMAFLFREFEMPPNYIADFLLVGKNSDGYHFVFVEFEKPFGAICTEDGDLGVTIRKGIKQLNDWDYWLEKNFSNLIPVFEKYLGFHENVLPKEFYQLDKTRINYAVVAGRRSNFSEKTYRLKRKLWRENNFLLLHYDNLIDDTGQIFRNKNFV